MLNDQKNNLRNRWGLGIGAFAVFYSGQGINTLAIPYFQMTLGIDPFYLSLALTLPILIAATMAPSLGHYSDSIQDPNKRRKPFLIAASLCSALVYGVVWSTPVNWPHEITLCFLFVIVLIFYLSATCYNTAYTALLYEFTEDPAERLKAIALKAYFFKFGSILYQWVFPLSQLTIFNSVSSGVRTIGWCISFWVFLVCGLAPVLLTQSKNVLTKTAKGSFFKGISAAIKNTKIRLILIILVFQFGGAVFAAASDYYLLVYYVSGGDIGEGAILKGILSSSYAIFGLIYVKLLSFSCTRLGLGKTLCAVFIVNAVGGLAKWWIFSPTMAQWIWIDAVLCSAVWSAMIVIIPSMLSRICLADQLGTGLVGALQSWITSSGGILAMVCFGLALNLLGFDAKFGAEQKDNTILFLRGLLSIGTVFFSVLCLAVLLFTKTHLKHSKLW